MDIVCFHNPYEENGYLSNWYLSNFTILGIEFSSMEQYMMYNKAICFKDERAAHAILSTNDVAEIKALGRSVTNYDDHYWNGVRQIIVFEGLLAKFTQNEQLRQQLIATHGSILVECAVVDTIWGIGLSMSDPRRFHRDAWKGQNLLGYALMQVRDQV